MKRKVIEINEDKCVGCGLCANACEQSAIQIIDGKAKLVSDSYCDGLGMCLPKCPVDAIHLVEKETEEFDKSRKGINKKSDKLACGCPGTMEQTIKRENTKVEEKNETKEEKTFDVRSELQQWPVQLKLVSPNAPYLENADLLIAADCTAFAYGNFHKDFIKDKITVIGCPKLDDNQYYVEKLTEMLANNDINSITVVRMTVPCCGGIVSAAKQAMLNSGKIVQYKEVVISTNGEIVNK